MSEGQQKGPFTDEQNNRMTELFRIIASYTVAVVGNPDTQDIAKVQFGTGVKLRIKNRLFVISAKHCIKENGGIPINSVLIAGTYDAITLPGRPSETLAVRAVVNRDIGYIEVPDDGSAAAGLGNLAEAHPICEIQQTEMGQARHIYTFMGHPMYEKDKSPMLEYLSPYRRPGLLMQPVPQFTKRPMMLPCRSVSEDQYCFEYPDRDIITVEPLTNKVEPSELPSQPIGYSGCGIWNEKLQSSADGLSLPETLVRLFAIQSSRIPDYASGEWLLSAIPIRHAIRLIQNHYEDLRPLIGSYLQGQEESLDNL